MVHPRRASSQGSCIPAAPSGCQGVSQGHCPQCPPGNRGTWVMQRQQGEQGGTRRAQGRPDDAGHSTARDAPRARAAYGTDSPCTSAQVLRLQRRWGCLNGARWVYGADPAWKWHPWDQTLTQGPLQPSPHSAAPPTRSASSIPHPSTACTGLVLVLWD